ncbi:Putative amidase domain-containing protein [Streptomyces sp. DI166]|uniref:DNRLRE domain-containing protein n=1 Tax=Streptomyces sp. DI166 TaxID=1839783 RepID=UPI0007F478FE|nr:DNRLRE domain-containing protein [Streptomyces sp. DI166]SBT92456.1 Putative amidase domain-containing protein [Streptomyces sp. DI166]
MQRTSRRRWVQATAALTLAGFLTGDPYLASPPAPDTDQIVNSPATAVTLGDSEPDIAELLGLSEEQAARRNAHIQNRRIELLSQRTETSSVYVNPDGTLTAETYAGPVRIQEADGSWSPIDTELADEGPALEPQAAAADITVSDGGDRKLASVAKGSAVMALGWEETLPTPTVKDDTASYDLGDGQTLTVTALKQGFSQNVLLDEAPTEDLTYRIPVTLKGLTLSEADSGHLLLKNGAGKLVAEAPAPMMWDSSVDERSGEPKHLAPVDTEIETAADGSQTLVLRPDAGFFAQDLTYPVTVDPTSTLSATTDTWVATNYPDSQVSSTELKSGTYNGGSTVARSFLKFDVSAYQGVHVIDTNLALYSYWSSSCTGGSGTAVRRVTEAWTPSAVTWADPPASTTTGQVVNTGAKGFSADCPAGNLNFDIDAIVQAWTSGTANHGLLVRGVDEKDSYTWRRFHSANYVSGGNGATEPHLTITYNTYPEVPAAPSLAPVTGTSVVTSTTPVLSALVDDSEPQRVRAQYAIEPNPAYNDTTYTLTADTPYVDTGETAALAVPDSNPLPNGKHLRVRARSFDGTDHSTAWSAWKNFTVDTSKAPVPEVPGDLATGATQTTTPLLTGVVTAAGRGSVSAEYLFYDASGAPVGEPLTASVQDGDRAVAEVPSGLLADGSTYRWKMRACADGLCSAYTALQTFTVDVAEEPAPSGTTGTPPEAVTDLRAVPGENGALVTWSAAEFVGEPTDTVTYTVTAVASDGTTVGTKTTTGLSAVFDGLDADAGDITYTFKVTGRNTYGTGATATSAGIVPAAVPGGTNAYAAVLEAYYAARGGLVQGSHVDANTAAASSAYGPQFVARLAAEQELLLRERVSGSEDDSDNVAPDATFSDVLAMPSADGQTVVLRAKVQTRDTIVTDVSTETADPTEQTGVTEVRYTFSAGTKPVLLSAVVASAKEAVVRPTPAALADFAHSVETDVLPDGLDASEFDGDSTDDGSETGVTTVSADALQTGTYLRTGAATWAVSNWNAPAMYSQDCTNFVSRAIHYGGSVKMKGSGDEDHKSKSYWWRKPSNWFHDETYTWINAAYLKTFMERHMLDSKRNTSNAFTGDIVFYDWKNDGKIDHASIISKISNGKIYVTQHNKNYKYRSLSAQKNAEPKMKIWIYRPKPRWY